MKLIFGRQWAAQLQRMNFANAVRLPIALVIAAVAVPVAEGARGEAPSRDPAGLYSKIALPPVAIAIDTTLPNGLRVIIAPDHDAPVIGLCVTYNVGSRDEQPGQSGLAHLVEHMMFEGSDNVGRGEHLMLMQNNGGNMNASTDQDETSFFELLPTNQLDMGLFAEADRMRSLHFEASAVEKERKVVEEEQRQFVDNRPFGKSFVSIDTASYDAFAYKHSMFGSVQDLDRLTRRDLEAFFRVYYTPANAILTLAGDVNPSDALGKVRKYFAFPGAPAPSRQAPSDAVQFAERRVELHDPLARSSQLLMAYPIPPGNTTGNDAMIVLAATLGSAGSRMYQTLVKQKHLANELEIKADNRAGPSRFYVLASPGPGISIGELLTAITAELDRVAGEGVTPTELLRGLKALRQSAIERRGSELNVAIDIGQLTSRFASPDLINAALPRFASLSSGAIQAAASQYLSAPHRTIVITQPELALFGIGLQTAKAMPLGRQAEDLHTSTPPEQVQRLARAPVNGLPLGFAMPRPATWRLANGMTAAAVENHRLPTVSLEMRIAPGTLAEAARKADWLR